MLHFFQIVKSANGGILFKIDNLKLDAKKIVGLIGPNGSGKTTLAKIIIGQEEPDKGKINNSFETFYFASKPETSYWDLIQVVKANYELLILDEPTVFLTAGESEDLIKLIKKQHSAVIIISHNWEFLGRLADCIWEIDHQQVKEYQMNFANYQITKENEISAQKEKFQQYIKEKRRLKKSIQLRESHSKKVKKTAQRMGNSEAKLMKWNKQGSSAVDRQKNSLQLKLQNLTVQENEQYFAKKIFFKNEPKLNKKSLLFCKELDINVASDEKVWIQGNLELIGKLFLKIRKRDEKFIVLNPQARVGVLDFQTKIVPDYLLVEDYLKQKNYPLNETRQYLAQFGYQEKIFTKKIYALSSGEIIQLKLACLLTENNNLLLLKRPTEYLDFEIASMLVQALKEYSGTIILETNDLKLAQAITTKKIFVG